MENKENMEFPYQIIKDEYETELYGFTLRNYKRENTNFVEKKINEVMQEINPIIFNLVKDISEENKAKIMAVTKIIKNNIIEDCKEDVEKLINAKIEDSLAIPKNVVLHKDRVQTRQISDEEYQKFEEEVFEMKRIMLENAVFIDQLNIEWNSYQIDDRVAVEGRTIKLAEEALNSISYDSDILLNNVRKTSN